MVARQTPHSFKLASHSCIGGVPRPTQHGFTLVELVVTLAIAGILAGIAIPSFKEIIANQRSKSAATDMYLSLVKARAEALKRNTNVTVKAASAGWQEGWSVVDAVDDTRVIEAHGPVKALSVAGVAEVTYRPSGRLNLSTNAPSFDITVSGSSKHICLGIDLNGRPHQRSSDSSC